MNRLNLCTLLALISAKAIAVAQIYSIPVAGFPAGGGTSGAGGYLLNGTIGQPWVGTMNAGNYSVTGGRWAIIGTVQTPGAPAISIYPTVTNTLLISWASTSTGFVLQSNQSLASTNWANLDQVPVDNGLTKSIVVSMPRGHVVFRLKK